MFFLRSGIPFVRFLIVFIMGIAFAIAYKPSLNFHLLSCFFICYVLIIFLEKRYLKLFFLKSILGYIGLFLLGIQALMMHDEGSNLNHYKVSIDSIGYYEAEIIQMPEEKEKTFKAVLEVKQVKLGTLWIKSSGKLIGYFPKTKSYKKGMLMLIIGKPSLVRNADNPEQFDYKGYLERQNIFATHYIKEGNFRQIGFVGDYWFNDLASRFRNFCEKILKEGIKNEAEYTIASALLLGIRGELDQDLYQAYSDTGTVHALAVSGMHVSLIYLFIVLVFGFIKRIQYGGKYLFTGLALSIFWFYALVTGFSPSVVRAVTMFSIVLMAGLLKRNAGIYNTLAFSAFIILCFEPFWILDIGFQFSFLAVVGIAYIYPILNESFSFSSIVLEKIWALVSVSLSAQLAVAPLSIYYFHSFPLLFLLFNILIVPISTIAMYTGLGGLMVFKIKILSDFLLLLTDYVLRLMNYIVLLPSHSKLLKLDFLSLTLVEVILMYLLLSFLFFAIKNRKIWSFRIFFFLSILFFASILYSNYLNYSKKNFTLYKIKGRSVFSITNGGVVELYSDNPISINEKDIRYAVYNHFASLGVNKINILTLTNKTEVGGQLIVFDGLKVLWLDKPSFSELNVNSLNKMNIIIVSDKLVYYYLKKYKSNLTAQILIDSSVTFFNKHDTCFYDVNQKGAYIYEWQ